MTEAEAWLEIIERVHDRAHQGATSFLCLAVTDLFMTSRIDAATASTMRARIRLFANGHYCYWGVNRGDDLQERTLAACFCLAMCEAGEAA